MRVENNMQHNALVDPIVEFDDMQQQAVDKQASKKLNAVCTACEAMIRWL